MKYGGSKPVRCAIYTRVSTDHGLEQDFNLLDAQHDAAQAYIRSQAHAGWTLIRSRYDDGGYSGGSTERPALQRLLADVRTGKVDIIVVYKVDRLTRSLADFAKLVETCSRTITGGREHLLTAFRRGMSSRAAVVDNSTGLRRPRRRSQTSIKA